jgi:hypothetical protein
MKNAFFGIKDNIQIKYKKRIVDEQRSISVNKATSPMPVLQPMVQARRVLYTT